MTTFSEFHKLDKTQPELDFVDIEINKDLPLFVDPYSFTQRIDPWSMLCHTTIVSFFDNLTEAIKNGQTERATYLLSNLHEPNETRLGFSKGVPKGSGIGKYQSKQMINALTHSAAVKTGFLSNLEECELLIPGIGRDKISDLTTNVLRGHFSTYTKQQCDLHGINTSPVPLHPYFDVDTGTWFNDYYNLPIVNGKPILLVPKLFVRWDPYYNHQKYYQHFMLSFLQAEHLNANSSLVYTIKNGERKVNKSDIIPDYPLTKKVLFEFSKEHPEILEDYRNYLKEQRIIDSKEISQVDDEIQISKALIIALTSIPPGSDDAENYHRLMIGVMQFLFFPNLLNPKKEKEIHEGRKRIDILMENGALEGSLYRLHDVSDLPCTYVPIECKNYSNDVANPELDQLSGRFSNIRGMFGILSCRQFKNRKRFIKRCQDTLKDGRGLIIPFDDGAIILMLSLIIEGRRNEIDGFINQLISEVWVS